MIKEILNFKWSKNNFFGDGAVISTTNQGVLQVTNSPTITNLAVKNLSVKNLKILPRTGFASLGQLSYNKKNGKPEYYNGKEWIAFNIGNNKYPQTPFLNQQWGLDMIYVKAAWNKGYNGKGITIMICDAGTDNTHPDLGNINVSISSSGDQEPYLPELIENHGTACASIAAGTGSKYVTGVAFNAILGSIDIFKTEYIGLIWELSNVDIYSCSFGVEEDIIKIFIQPPEFISAINTGITNGRKGKGAIYVFAAGNGSLDGFQTAYGAYTNNIGVIGVGAINKDGTETDYSTAGLSVLISEPAGKAAETPNTGIGIFSALCLGNNSAPTQSSMNGTSAACPHISGICALMLQANPLLTWRDVQMILFLSSLYTLYEKPEYKNAVGYYYSRKLGYGVPHCGIVTDLAKNWVNLPENSYQVLENIINQQIPIIPNDSLIIEFNFNELIGKSVEHIIFSMETEGDGQLEIDVTILAPNCTVPINIVFHREETDIQQWTYDVPIKCEAFRLNPAYSETSKWKIGFKDMILNNNYVTIKKVKLEIWAFNQEYNYVELASKIRKENIFNADLS
jgi:kexin